MSDQSSALGGAEIVALLSAQKMADAGVPVTFLTGDSAEDCPLDRSAIEVVALGGDSIARSNPVAGAARGLFNRRAYDLIRSYVARNDTPDTVYHLNNWTKILSPAALLALRPVSDRLFMSAHDFALVCPNLSYTNYQRGGETCPLTPLGARCLATHCDKKSYANKLWRAARSLERKWILNLGQARSLIGLIHPDMIEYFTRAGVPSERLRILRNPVNPFTTERVRAEANTDLFFIGRLAEEKGVDLAAEAARRAGRRLRVIGDGELRSSLEIRYPEAVFEGWRTHDQIGALIVEARALLVTSRLPETFTLVAHEAMRSGVPVIAFSDVDCRDAAEIGAAIAAPPRSVQALVDGIRRLDDDGAARRMSEIAFTQGARFSSTPAVWAETLMGCYEELLTPSSIHLAAPDRARLAG